MALALRPRRDNAKLGEPTEERRIDDFGVQFLRLDRETGKEPGAARGQVAIIGYNNDDPGGAPSDTIYSDAVHATVTVAGVNDASINANAGQLASGSEDATFNIAGLSVTAGQSVTVTLAVTRGTLSIDTGIANGIVAGEITGGANGSDTVTITAAADKINTTFASASGVQYTGGTNVNGTVTLTMTSNGQDSDTYTVSVIAVNDAPTVINGTTQAAATILEDKPADLTGPTSPPQTVADLFGGHFSDAADDQSAFPGGSSANTLAGVAITANGSAGGTGQWQYYDGSSWVNIGAASMTSAKLLTATTPVRFNPNPDYNSSIAPTLVGALIDSSVAAFTNASANINLTALGTGGTTAYSSQKVTISQTVTAVNDAPSFAVIAGTAITRVSTDAAGAQAASDSHSPVFSPDGTKLAFVSFASNLVAGDTNGWPDIFVKDLISGAISRVSTDATGTEAIGGGGNSPVFSPDGTKVAFSSGASNLVVGDSNGREDVFVKDLVSGAISRVSTDATGAQATGGDSLDPVFSPDGTKVAFSSNATNLVVGDTNGQYDIFVKDLVSGEISRVSTNAVGAQATGGNSQAPVFSPDGTKVAFYSFASDLVAGDTNDGSDIFVKDLVSGAISRVSTDSAGAQSSGSSSTPVFSPDGTKIAFSAGATNLVAGDTNGFRDIFVKDLVSGAVIRVSTSSAGAQTTGGDSENPVFSPDGHKVAFFSSATNLVAGDTNGQRDIFVKDLVSGATSRVSTTSADAQAINGNSLTPVFSPDGTRIAFASSATNLVVGDSNGRGDIFVKGGPPTFTQNGVGVAPTGAVNVADSDSAVYAGGTLSVSVSANAAAGDALTISSSGGVTGINVIGSSVRFNNVEIGILTAGATNFSVALDSDATDAAVKALAEAVRFATSDNSSNASRTITYTLVDGGGTTAGGADTASFDVSVYATDENAVLNVPAASGARLENTDSGAGPRLVASVAGNAANVGDTVTLASGAKVTLNADGSLTYDPNGKFGYLISAAMAAATGAVNSSAVETFTYVVNGGSPVTVAVTLTGVSPAGDELRGDAGANTITGTNGNDSFRLEQGGIDFVFGGGGNDGFFFGASFTAADQVDGGAGTNDQIGLQGNYAGGNALVLGANTITNIEAIVVLPGFSYNITTVDANVASGGVLAVQATQLAAGQNLVFDGSAETNGRFIIYGGQGNDNFTGGAGNDGFFFGPGGYTSADIVNGGAGTNDQLALDGDYAITLAGNVTNVEVLVLMHGPSGTPNHFDITSGNAFVAVGQTMTIFGLQVETSILFSGAGELDGAFKIYGGTNANSLTAGAGADWLFGGSGADSLTGGGGNDIFYYNAVVQSTAANADIVFDFTSGDKIDVSGIDAISGGADDAFSFLGSGAFTNHAGELRAVDQGGSWLVQADVDGDGNADLQLTLIVSDAHPIALGDFTL